MVWDLRLMYIGYVCKQNRQWQRHVTVTTYCTCLGHLGWRDTDRIVSIFVVLPKVAKASTSAPLSSVIVTSISVPTFANVNTALFDSTLMIHLHVQFQDLNLLQAGSFL